jgi:hypothetical protein
MATKHLIASEPAATSSRRVKLALFAVATLLIVPHGLFAFRDTFGDEHAIVANALSFLAKKTLIPQSTSYPSLYSYLATPFVALGAVVLAKVGQFASVRDAVAVAIADDRWFLVIGPRILSIALLVAVALLSVFGLRRRFGALPAYFGGALILTSPSLSGRGTFALPDVLVLLCCFCSFLLLLRYATEHGAPRVLYLASAFAGLAFSAKYNGGAAALPIAYVLASDFVRRKSSLSDSLQRAGLSAGVFLVAFLCGTPGWLLAPGVYWQGLAFELDHAERGHLGSSGIPVLGQLELLVKHEPLLLALGLVGLFHQRTPRDRAFGVAIAVLVSGLGTAALSRKQSIQYLYPFLPGLLYFALEGLRQTLSARWKVGVLTALIAVGAGVNYQQGAAAAFTPSTTEMTRRWIYQHIPPGSEVALETNYVPRLFSEAGVERIASDKLKGGPRVAAYLRREHPRYRVRELVYDEGWLRREGAEFIVTSSSAYQRFFTSGLFTGRAPSPDSATGHEFARKKAFYAELFESGRWTEVFQVDAANGPHTRIFARRRGAPALSPASQADTSFLPQQLESTK